MRFAFQRASKGSNYKQPHPFFRTPLESFSCLLHHPTHQPPWEGHGGRIGDQGSQTGGSNSECVSVPAEWACSCPKCALSDFPEPHGECVQGFPKVKGTMGYNSQTSRLARRNVTLGYQGIPATPSAAGSVKVQATHPLKSVRARAKVLPRDSETQSSPMSAFLQPTQGPRHLSPMSWKQLPRGHASGAIHGLFIH